MKAFLMTCFMALTAMNSWAQSSDNVFRGKLVNSELEVMIVLNLYEKNVKVPQQELFGDVDGYLCYKHDGRKWIIVESEVQGDRALLTLINDYGSEDLTASLIQQSDGTYEFRQEKGSTIKIVKNRKWVKLPKKITFVKD